MFPKVLRGYALELSPTSLDNYRRVLLNVFNFAMKRRYRDDNPAKLTEKPDVWQALKDLPEET